MEDFEGIEQSKRSDWPIRLLILFVLAIPAGLGYLAYRLLSRPPATPEMVSASATPMPLAATNPTELPTLSKTPLPALDQSDAFVRNLVEALSSRPAWAKWLATEGLVRRFVVAVDNVAEGISPNKHLSMLAPKEGFDAIDRHGDFVVDPKSYRRHDLVAEVVASLDTERVAQAYRELNPLIQDAYRELGYPNRHFDQTLARAIDRLLQTPVPEGTVALRPAVKSYKFADPNLEALSPVQKQFLRLGPDNMKKVQQKLRELREELALPKS